LDICSMCAVLYFTLVGNASQVHLFILSRGMATAAYSNAKPEGNAGWISKHMRPKLKVRHLRGACLRFFS
jgi:hypothetical protein